MSMNNVQSKAIRATELWTAWPAEWREYIRDLVDQKPEFPAWPQHVVGRPEAEKLDAMIEGAWRMFTLGVASLGDDATASAINGVRRFARSIRLVVKAVSYRVALEEGEDVFDPERRFGTPRQRLVDGSPKGWERGRLENAFWEARYASPEWKRWKQVQDGARYSTPEYREAESARRQTPKYCAWVANHQEVINLNARRRRWEGKLKEARSLVERRDAGEKLAEVMIELSRYGSAPATPTPQSLMDRAELRDAAQESFAAMQAACRAETIRESMNYGELLDAAE